MVAISCFTAPPWPTTTRFLSPMAPRPLVSLDDLDVCLMGFLVKSLNTRRETVKPLRAPHQSCVYKAPHTATILGWSAKFAMAFWQLPLSVSQRILPPQNGHSQAPATPIVLTRGYQHGIPNRQKEYISAPVAPGKVFSYFPLVLPLFSHCLSLCWGPAVV